MPTQTIRASDGTELDAGVVNLSKAIRQRESKGNYNAIGDAGTSKGAYQWQPGNFENAAKKFGLDPNDFSPVNQDKVAYYQIKEMKDRGLTPEQVAAAWNAGEGKLKNDAWKTNKGVTTINGQKIAYDTPAYVNEVTKNFQALKGSVAGIPGAMPQQQQEAPQGQSFTSDIAATGTRFGQRITQALGAQNDISIPSRVIQTAGAFAGGLGDLTTNVLEHTPVVGTVFKGLEGLIGKGVGALAESSVGQGVISNFNSLPKEIQDDIISGIDIAAAIPLLKGLSVAKSGVKGAVTSAVDKTTGRVTKGAQQEIRGALTTQKQVKGLVNAEKRGANPVGLLTKDKQYLPDVVNADGKFVYNSQKAMQALNQSVDVDEAALQEMLKTAVKKNVGVDLEIVRQRVLKDVAKEYAMSGNFKSAKKAVNDYFDSFLESTGGRKIVDLNELNALKRDVRGSVFDVAGDVKGTLSADVKAAMGQSVMKQVEEIAAKVGVKGVNKLNKTMGEKIEALKILKAMDGKGIKGAGTAFRELSQDVAGAIGEAAGGSIGIPLASTFAGRSLGRLVSRKVPKTPIGKLRQTTQAIPKVRKGLIQVGAGLGVQQENPNPQR